MFGDCLQPMTVSVVEKILPNFAAPVQLEDRSEFQRI
jgi:hypothetical protein